VSASAFGGLFSERGDAAAVVRALPPEHRDRLTFHLPLELQALEVAGASRDEIGDRIDRRLPEAFAASLVDPPLYRRSVADHLDLAGALAGEDLERRRAAFAGLVPLGAGLAGGAFHALIRLGYGSLRHDPLEIAHGLAYLRTRRQVLFGTPVREAGAAEISWPGSDELSNVSVFDQLDFVAGAPALTPIGAEVPARHPAELFGIAKGLVTRSPSSFIAVHTVTGLHALCEVDHLLTGRSDLSELPGDELLDSWWLAMQRAIAACALVIGACESDPPTRPRPELSNLEGLVRLSIDSCEVHDLKISVALSRLCALRVATESEALLVGEEKLAATECSL
jgi:hypothetical protein